MSTLHIVIRQENGQDPASLKQALGTGQSNKPGISGDGQGRSQRGGV